MKTTRRKGYLLLEDGTKFEGTIYGATQGDSLTVCGEVVFNTSMSGYQEIMTDPSYRGQLMTFTAPHIGNVGCNEVDVESEAVQVEGIITRELTRAPSNYRSSMTIEEYLAETNRVALSDVDTRRLVLHLREKGAMIGAIGFQEQAEDSLRASISEFGSMEGKDYVSAVSCQAPYEWREGTWSLEAQNFESFRPEELHSRPHVVVLDCGVKRNILRLLVASGFRVSVAPSFYSAEQLLALKPDGILLSNGPGDPSALDSICSVIDELLGKIPMFGICLGHQLLSRTLGAKTYKLKFGHRGANHPVMRMEDKAVFITVQNHGFAVEPSDDLPDLEVTHINLNDQTVAGVRSKSRKAFAVQFHPEASAGPLDTSFLFKEFFDFVVG